MSFTPVTLRTIGQCVDCGKPVRSTLKGTEWCPACAAKHQITLALEELAPVAKVAAKRSRCACGGVKRAADTRCDKCWNKMHLTLNLG